MARDSLAGIPRHVWASSLVVLAFAAFCIWLVVSVQSLRGQLAANVYALTALQKAQAALELDPPDWTIAGSELRTLDPAPASLAVASDDAALRATPPAALRSAIHKAVAARRGNAAAISVELGKRWIALYLVVAGALLLGLINLGLGVVTYRQRIRAERSERELAAGLSTLQATATRLARGDLGTPVAPRDSVPDAFEAALESMRQDMVQKVDELEERNRAIVSLNDDLRAQIRTRSEEIENLAARQLDEGDDVRPGAIFAERYCIVRPIASGSSGDVYEVVNIGDGRSLALKLLRTVRDAPSMARFAREARLLAELRHRHVVAVVQVGISDAGSPFLVMERVRGSDLRSGPERDTPWLLEVLGQVASALDAAHSAGIVHRDVKPANIVVDDTSETPLAKLVDFGIARMDKTCETMLRAPSAPAAALAPVNGSSPSSLDTHAGFVIGTPQFVAPELSAVGAQATPASDVFSFGVTAYRLLTGAVPFDTPPINLAQSQKAPPKPNGIGELCSPDIADLFMRCLDFAADRRPSAQEIAERLLGGGQQALRGAAT